MKLLQNISEILDAAKIEYKTTYWGHAMVGNTYIHFSYDGGHAPRRVMMKNRNGYRWFKIDGMHMEPNVEMLKIKLKEIEGGLMLKSVEKMLTEELMEVVA